MRLSILSYIWPDWIGPGFPPASQDIRSYSETRLELLHLSHSRGFCCSWTSSGGLGSAFLWRQYSNFLMFFWVLTLLLPPEIFYKLLSSLSSCIHPLLPLGMIIQFSLLLNKPFCSLLSHCGPGAVCCCPVSSSYPNTWLFTSLGIQEDYSLLSKHQERHHFILLQLGFQDSALMRSPDLQFQRFY